MAVPSFKHKWMNLVHAQGLGEEQFQRGAPLHMGTPGLSQNLATTVGAKRPESLFNTLDFIFKYSPPTFFWLCIQIRKI